MQAFIVKEKSELPATAATLLQIAGKRRKFVLYGDLGAGKTTLVQSLCAVLGVQDTVASPTFSLVNEYRCTDPADQSVQPVYHLDLYRLKDLDEALAIGIEEYLDSPAYCFIEWPQVIEPLLDSDVVELHLEVLPGDSRKILFLSESDSSTQP